LILRGFLEVVDIDENVHFIYKYNISSLLRGKGFQYAEEIIDNFGLITFFFTLLWHPDYTSSFTYISSSDHFL
jgi:hypothetical protein